MDLSIVLQFFISGVNLGCIYAALGLGFFIIYSVTRVLNLAQGEFVMLGGMLTVTFYSMGVPILLSTLVAVVIAGLLGGVLYRGVIHPARNLSKATQTFLTVGFAFAIEGIALLIWGWEYRSLPNFLGTPNIHLGGATIIGQTPWVTGITLLVVTGLFFFFGHTIQGKALRACADNPLGAKTIGISVERMSLYAFILAGTLGGIAGAIITPLTMVSYSIGFPMTIKGLLAAFVGGITRAEGVILGGMVLGMAEAIAASLIPSGYHSIFALIILMAVFLCQPRGLLSSPGKT
ncbi:MAG: branched-chain amino acid ABC transporter permease [Dehalococcoidia bacterium]|nr:branched-chain amino acid ABC transporter permease [Dehalococcoidia bacterium]